MSNVIINDPELHLQVTIMFIHFPSTIPTSTRFSSFFFPVTSATLQARPPEITSDCTSTPSHPGTSARSANLKLISWSSRGRDSRGSWSKSVYIIIWNVYIKAIYIYIYIICMYLITIYIYIQIGHILKIYDEYVYIYTLHNFHPYKKGWRFRIWYN